MKYSRRRFLQSMVGTSTVVSLSPMLPTFLERSALAATDTERANENVLVVVQLSGGNDGLNTLVPYADDAYARSRTTLRLTASEVHKIDPLLGLHPNMQSFQRLLNEGRLTIVQGVGYPNSDRGHNEAMRDWHTARPGDVVCQTGWLGRVIDRIDLPNQTAVTGALVAPIPLPLAMVAQRAIVPSVRSADQWILRGGDHQRSQISKAVELSSSDRENPLADHVRRGTIAAHATSRQVTAILRGADRRVYPEFSLSNQLKTIAELIRADVGVRIYFAEIGGGGIGGFDNHANQRDNHAALLREVSVSIAAFIDDLKTAGLLDRVLLMTFSEFGRTLSENGRRGTDHGAAAPVFLAGGKLEGGLVGEHPSLTDLQGDAPKPGIDYRQLYATVLEEWLRFDSQAVLDAKYEKLDVFV